ncbi:transposase [Plakobranchus ocellatus]|uniref:Transposase n=1 Tax=Plakobranchus ocellatus TaxID=259542 RepID=A0AAV3YEA2_9GAST|nr:transposase [Plakobranchus ocellatus]
MEPLNVYPKKKPETGKPAPNCKISNVEELVKKTLWEDVTRECIDRKCGVCGVSELVEAVEHEVGSRMENVVEWKRWEKRICEGSLSLRFLSCTCSISLFGEKGECENEAMTLGWKDSDGNYVPRALSLAMFDKEDFHLEVTCRIVLELTEHVEEYANALDDSMSQVLLQSTQIKALKGVTANFKRSCTSFRYVESGTANIALPIKEASQSRRIFSLEEEAVLVEYLLKASRIGFPLDTSTLKSLAYDLAIRYSKRVPDSWRTQKSAGKDWLKGFKSRHSQLSIRTPEPTSIARATVFNKTNVGPFFDKLKQLYQELSLTPERFYNVDETALSTSQKPQKVVAESRVKQVA